MTETDLIIYCCLGGGVGLIIVLVSILYCRRLRAQKLLNSSGSRTGHLLEHHEEEEDERRRKRSNITQESAGATTTGGGDLADYLQNLVDGMERGRAERGLTMPPGHQPPLLASRSGSTQANPALGLMRRSGSTAVNGRYVGGEAYGGDSSLLTIVPSSRSNIGREGSPSLQQAPSAGRPGATAAFRPLDFEGNQVEGLSEEKAKCIERWRETVDRETTGVDVVLDDPSRLCDSPPMDVADDTSESRWQP